MIESILQAAYELGRDDVLPDPSDQDIVLYAVELARGSWPSCFRPTEEFTRQCVEAYEKGEDAR